MGLVGKRFIKRIDLQDRRGWASLMAQRLKHLPGMQKTQVQSLGREDPLEKEMATHSSTLAWRIPWREEPGRLLVHGVAKSQTRLSDFTHFTFTFDILGKYCYYDFDYPPTFLPLLLYFCFGLCLCFACFL